MDMNSGCPEKIRNADEMRSRALHWRGEELNKWHRCAMALYGGEKNGAAGELQSIDERVNRTAVNRGDARGNCMEVKCPQVAKEQNSSGVEMDEQLWNRSEMPWISKKTLTYDTRWQHDTRKGEQNENPY